MFKAILEVQWKGARAIALLAALAGFALPVISAQMVLPSEAVPVVDGRSIVLTMQSFGVAYAMLAAGCGLAFAMLAWTADHRGRHVYALILPVRRARYALMRFGAGMLFVLIPTAALLLGALVAVAMVKLPAGLHAYPVALTLRFFVAATLAFAIFFAISSATARTAAMVLGVIGAVLIVSAVLDAASARMGSGAFLSTVLFVEPGLLSVFTGRWSLFDA